MKKKLFTLLLAVMAVVGTLYAKSGTCGKNLTWDLTDGVLTISGSGTMNDYSYRSPAPWYLQNSSITSVGFGDGVTSIGDYAFYGCSGLTSVTIPSSVTSIGSSAFYGCSGLTSLEIANSVTSIGTSAFYNVFNIIYSGSATGSPWGARFINSYTDGYLVYSDNTKTTLLGCSTKIIGDLIIPNSVTSIGERAFSGCSGLTSVTIPSSVTNIGSSAFSGCSGLTSLEIPNSVTSIGNYAFYGCSDLTSLEIPNSVTSIGYSAFYNVFNIIYSGSATGSPWGARFINSYTDGYLVYSDNTKTTLLGYSTEIIGDLIIPNSVTSIGERAFYGCSGLTSVTIPNSVTSIGERAFYGCSGLTSVTIPSSVTSIGSSAFSDCTGLTSIEIPNSVTSIGGWAFYGCSGLTSVTIPNSVTSIGRKAFSDCKNLNSIIVADENPNYCSVDGVLFNKDKTMLIQYPRSKQDTEYIIPNSVTYFEQTAFDSCTNLTSITLSNGISSIEQDGGSWAFIGCTSLTSIKVDETHPIFCSVDGVLFSKNKKHLIKCPEGKQGTTYTIPNSVTEIDFGAFRGCTHFTSVTISNNVCYIGQEAFAGCTGMTSVIIGYSVEMIGYIAFSRCNSLASITCKAPSPPRFGSSGSSEGLNTSIPLYVPKNSINSYKNSSASWKRFNDIRAIEEEETCPISDGLCGAQGDNITWELSCDGILTISGTGDMTDYTSYPEDEYGHAPWYAYRHLIQSVILEGSITHIGDIAFSGCTGLTSIEIPNSVTSIGTSAINGCTGLTTINVDAENSSYCDIDGVLFSKDQTELILFPAKKIATEYTIPNSVTSIGGGAFNYCSSLTSITIPNGVTSIGSGAFSYCSSLTSLTIPDNVTSIGGSAFAHCTSLTSVNIPKNITEIGPLTFSSCSSLTSITIPNTVTSIGYKAFQSCNHWTSITCEATIPPTLQIDVFRSTDLSTPLYVPAESIDAYKAASQWKDFTNIQPIVKPLLVHFVDWNGAELKTDTVNTGEGATAPVDPIRTGYTFTGWDKDFSIVTEDMTVTALYDINYYPVMLLGHDGALLSEQSVAYDQAAVKPEIPAREGYTFAGWTADIDHIIARTFAIALYDKIGGTVTFKSEEGDIIATENVDLHLPAAPSVAGKSFAGWLTEEADAENGIVLRATYTSDNPTTHDDVTVTPTSHSADVSFPFITGALTYELVIRDLSGNVVCKIMFNSAGQLLGIAFAPSRNRAQQQATQSTGFNFTVEGLNASTTYEYEFVAYDETDNVIEALTGSFTTSSDVATDVQNAPTSNSVQSIIQGGNVYILRGEKVWTVTGQEVK